MEPKPTSDQRDKPIGEGNGNNETVSGAQYLQQGETSMLFRTMKQEPSLWAPTLAFVIYLMSVVVPFAAPIV